MSSMYGLPQELPLTKAVATVDHNRTAHNADKGVKFEVRSEK